MVYIFSVEFNVPGDLLKIFLKISTNTSVCWCANENKKEIFLNNWIYGFPIPQFYGVYGIPLFHFMENFFIIYCRYIILVRLVKFTILISHSIQYFSSAPDTNMMYVSLNISFFLVFSFAFIKFSLFFVWIMLIFCILIDLNIQFYKCAK